jgi:hypothetical protein
MKGWGASQPPQAQLGGLKQQCQGREMRLLALLLLLTASCEKQDKTPPVNSDAAA